MLRTLAMAMCLAWLLATAVAAADAPYVPIEQRLGSEQLRATGLDGLSEAQLALLNRLLEAETRKAVSTARQDARTEASRDGSQRDPDPSRFIGLADKPIASRVRGPVSGWQPGHEFVLENGQVWKVLKGHMSLPETLQSPAIVVVPGIAGRWFLQVHEDLPKARVYRID